MTRTKKAVAIVASLASVLLLGSVFLPTLCRAREPANRVKCASNLKQIGQAMLLYGNENNGAFADSFATLLRTEDLMPDVFVCPKANAATAAKDKVAFAADPGLAHCDYDYLGDRMPAGMTFDKLPSNTVLALDREANHDHDGMNMLLGDGHVEFIAASSRRAAPWWIDVQSQIARGVRPVMLPAAATQPMQ